MKKRELVETKFFTFGDPREDVFFLENGAAFGPITLAYQTYGHLNAARDNAILLFHTLTGSQHAAGHNPAVQGVGSLWSDDCQDGWWDGFIGPGLALDTNKYFIVCANYLGGCYGSTGPMSPDPATGKPYGRRFPVVTAADVVNTQMRLLDHLGIKTLLAAVGGSLGGMMVLELATRYPERVHCLIPIATGARATTLHRLHNFEQIFAIEEDHNFNYGDYYEGAPPRMGLILARIISHKSFVHLHVMEDRARGEIVQAQNDLKGYRLQYQIESYMLHHGKKFVERFDANSYLRIVNMWQRFDLTTRGGTLAKAFAPCKNLDFLVFSIDSDVCYWPDEQQELCDALKAAGAKTRHVTEHSEKGHDSFLLEPELYTPHIAYFLAEMQTKSRPERPEGAGEANDYGSL